MLHWCFTILFKLKTTLSEEFTKAANDVLMQKFIKKQQNTVNTCYTIWLQGIRTRVSEQDVELNKAESIIWGMEIPNVIRFIKHLIDELVKTVSVNWTKLKKLKPSWRVAVKWWGAGHYWPVNNLNIMGRNCRIKMIINGSFITVYLSTRFTLLLILDVE